MKSSPLPSPQTLTPHPWRWLMTGSLKLLKELYAESDSSFFTVGRCRDFSWLSKHLNCLSELFSQIIFFQLESFLERLRSCSFFRPRRLVLNTLFKKLTSLWNSGIRHKTRDRISDENRAERWEIFESNIMIIDVACKLIRLVFFFYLITFPTADSAAMRMAPDKHVTTMLLPFPFKFAASKLANYYLIFKQFKLFTLLLFLCLTWFVIVIEPFDLF